jgi:C-terminal processing protease CtpA/Prc
VLSAEGKTWRVTRVLDDSPARDAGIAPDMTVASVDGKTADAITPDELREIWHRAAGTRVTVVIRDGENDRAVVLTLRDLL